MNNVKLSLVQLPSRVLQRIWFHVSIFMQLYLVLISLKVCFSFVSTTGFSRYYDLGCFNWQYLTQVFVLLLQPCGK